MQPEQKLNRTPGKRQEEPTPEREHPNLQNLTAASVVFLRIKAKASRLTTAQRLAALILAQHIYRGKHDCDPGTPRIARLMGCSLRTARVALDAICDTIDADPRECHYHPADNPPLFVRHRIPARSGWRWKYTLVRNPAAYVAKRDEQHRRRMTEQAKQHLNQTLRRLRAGKRESSEMSLVGGKDVQQTREQALGKYARSMNTPKVTAPQARRSAPCPTCGKPQILTADGTLLELLDPFGAERIHQCGVTDQAPPA